MNNCFDKAARQSFHSTLSKAKVNPNFYSERESAIISTMSHVAQNEDRHVLIWPIIFSGLVKMFWNNHFWMKFGTETHLNSSKQQTAAQTIS